MANAVVTLKIMPDSPGTDLEELERLARERIVSFAGKGDMRVVVEPVAFGLKALKVTFVVDESKGGTEPLEAEISKMPGVNSVDVVDVRRAIG